MKAKYAILLLTLVCPYCYILGGNQVGKKDAVRAALYYSTNRTTASHDGTKSYSPLQIQLLQKIEELTLYILQQEERINRLENNSNK